MQRMPEVEDLVEALADGMRRGDVDAVLALVSNDVTMMSGTDESEWWTGYDAVTSALQGQLEAGGGFDITTGAPRAFGEGGLSVFDDQPVMTSPEGQSLTVRLTGAARLEDDGQWRFVQVHFSLGVPNEDPGMPDDLPA